MSAKYCATVCWVVLAIGIAMPACSQDRSASSAEVPDNAGLTAAGAMLKEAELDRYSKAALDGDGDAAFRIYLHYQTGTDLRNAEFWVRIAAENGNLSGMINYADYLLDIPRGEQCRRARFWIKRARTSATSESDRSGVQTFERKLQGKCASLLD